ncbi:MAG: MBL fold metallo-hydrolase [Haloferacaceae archaeon]
MLELTYLGNATFGFSSGDTSLVVDPYIDDNPECPFDIEEALDLVGDGDVDAICVTHLGYDHVADALPLARDYGIPVITEPGTMHYLRRNGVPADRITKVGSGMKAVVGDLTVRALEAKHISTTVVDGDLVTGEPLGFLVDDGAASAYHLGDTSIFSDLELFGDLYAPDVSLVGVGQAHSEADADGPVTRILHELTTEEAVQVAKWVGSDRVVPMHYLPAEREAFLDAMAADDDDAPAVVPMEAGDTLTVG